MLVRFSYDYRVALFPSTRCELADFVFRGREKQARVADPRASYAIFSMYVDAETNFYLKRRTLFGDRRFSHPCATSHRPTRANPFAVPPVRVLLLSRRGCSFNLFRSAERARYRSPRSPWSDHRAVRSMARVPIAKYASKTKVCRGLSQAENVAGVRDFTGRFRAVTFCPAKKRSPSNSNNQFS